MKTLYKNYNLVKNSLNKVPTIYLFAIGFALLVILYLVITPTNLVFAQTDEVEGANSFLMNTGKYIGGGIVNFLLNYLIIPFLGFLVILVGFLVDQLASVLSAVMSYTNLGNVSVIADTWKVIRDGINIVFIAALLVAAIFNIIQYEPDSYSMSEYMPKFVIAVIGVNFSKLMCFFILDFVNVLTASIYEYIGGGKLGVYGEDIGKVIKDLIDYDNIFKNSWYDVFTGKYDTFQGTGLEDLESWQKAIMMALVLLMLGFVAHGMAGLIMVFVTRLIHLWVLVASSPIFFLGLSSEFISNLSTGWWEDFWKYAAIPIKAAAYLAIGMRLSENLKIELLASGGEMKLSELIILIVCILGTLDAAFSVAKDDGVGDKAGGWIKDKVMTPLWTKSLPAFGSLGFAASETIKARGSKGGKIVGKALQLATRPFRVANTVKGLTNIVGKELNRTQEQEQLRGSRQVLQPFAELAKFDWAKNAVKSNWDEQVETAHKVYKGQTTSQLQDSLNKTADKAELQAIVKELAEGQGVSLRTLMEDDHYKKFRGMIGYDYDENGTIEDNYKQFAKTMNVTFPYQFWNTITPAAHKKRDEEIEKAKRMTKELEEMNIQNYDGIFNFVQETINDGNGYLGTALAVTNISDANLTQDEALKMVLEMYRKGDIGIDELNMAGRTGQVQGQAVVAMLRRFTKQDMTNLTEEFGITNDEDGDQKLIDLFNAMAKDDTITTKNGYSFLAGGGASKLVEENIALDETRKTKFLKLSPEERRKISDAIADGQAVQSANGKIKIDKDEAKTLKQATLSNIESAGKMNLYNVMKPIQKGYNWFRSTYASSDPLKDNAYTRDEVKEDVATNSSVGTVTNAMRTSDRGVLQSNFDTHFLPMMKGATNDLFNTIKAVSKGLEGQILNDKDRIALLKAEKSEFDNRYAAYNGGDNRTRARIVSDDDKVIDTMEAQYEIKKEELKAAGIEDIKSWDDMLASQGATGKNSTEKIHAMREYLEEQVEVNNGADLRKKVTPVKETLNNQQNNNS